MRKASVEGLARRNLTLSNSTIDRLSQLKQSTGAASDSEVIRQALRVYEAICQPGKNVFLRDKETGEEILVLSP